MTSLIKIGLHCYFVYDSIGDGSEKARIIFELSTGDVCLVVHEVNIPKYDARWRLVLAHRGLGWIRSSMNEPLSELLWCNVT